MPDLAAHLGTHVRITTPDWTATGRLRTRGSGYTLDGSVTYPGVIVITEDHVTAVEPADTPAAEADPTIPAAAVHAAAAAMKAEMMRHPVPGPYGVSSYLGPSNEEIAEIAIRAALPFLANPAPEGTTHG